MRYIIDTDPGVDDAMALMLAVRSGIDIAAITTVAGNTTIENTTRNARHVLGLLQQTGIPVYSGAEKPLRREPEAATVHGESGLEGLDPSGDPGLTHDAVTRMCEIIKEYENVTLITLGPLTNVATAIQQEPDTMKRLNGIVIMGGAIREPGNINRVAEFNIYADPEAADIVFRFPVQKTLVPLDACHQVKLYMEDFRRVQGTLREPLLQLAEPFLANTEKEHGERAAIMYDPLTLYHVLSPPATSISSYDVRVETKGELTRGMTVADRRPLPFQGTMVDVVMDVDADAFREDFISYLSE